MTRATKPAKPPSKASARPRPKPPAAAEPKPAEPKPAQSRPDEPAISAELLAKQPATVVLDLLRDASEALSAGAIKQRLMESGGLTRSAAESAWNRARDRIRFDDHVIVEKNTYRYTAAARAISPEEALYRLSRAGDPAKRPELLAILQAALEGGTQDPDELAQARQKIGKLEQEIAKLSAEKAAAAPEPAPVDDTAHAQYERAERRRAARERQARIDAMAAVAELAAEVEELTAKRAAPDVLLEHTRALTGGTGLEAIGRAGEATPYDETHHDPVGDFPNEGDPVVVIRPGYLWHAPGEAVLISKAVVTRA